MQFARARSCALARKVRSGTFAAFAGVAIQTFNLRSILNTQALPLADVYAMC
jgi:hypothetical protein